MKILELDFDYYYYPDGISCVNDFIKYLNDNYNSFVKMISFDTEYCLFPFLISDETEVVYLNVAEINVVKEVDATVLTREEYDMRLEEVVKNKCLDCIHYHEDSEEDNLKGHRQEITLDGECLRYQKN